MISVAAGEGNVINIGRVHVLKCCLYLVVFPEQLCDKINASAGRLRGTAFRDSNSEKNTIDDTKIVIVPNVIRLKMLTCEYFRKIRFVWIGYICHLSFEMDSNKKNENNKFWKLRILVTVFKIFFYQK